MTAHKFVLPLFLLGFVTAACEEKQAPAPTPEAAADAKAPEAAAAAAEPTKGGEPVVAAAKDVPVVGPQEVCGAIIDAAHNKDDGKIVSLSTPATATAFNAEGAKDHVIKTFAAAACGAPKIEGDSATIALANTTPPQEATFSKSADGWRFDGAAFLAKYPVKAVKEAAKKAVGKAQKKGKEIKKKHGVH